jgi:hypothetical protein
VKGWDDWASAEVSKRLGPACVMTVYFDRNSGFWVASLGTRVCSCGSIDESIRGLFRLILEQPPL